MAERGETETRDTRSNTTPANRAVTTSTAALSSGGTSIQTPLTFVPHTWREGADPVAGVL
jgi:hypothetical protein